MSDQARRGVLAGFAIVGIATTVPRVAAAQGAGREPASLAKLVADRKLAPLASRLPARPMVV